MRKSIFSFVMVVVAVLFASCGGFQSKSYRLAEGLDILTYSVQAENGDTLWGVKLLDGTVLVEPMAKTFVVDKDCGILIAKNKAGLRFYYGLDGKELGEISGFKPLPCNDLIYKGYSKGKTMLYFAETKQLVEAEATYLSNSYLGYQTVNGFTVVSTQGESTTWNVPEGTFYWVDGQPAIGRPEQAKMVVVGKKNATVYSMDGNEEKTIPLARWKSLIKKVKMSPLGKGYSCKITQEL